MLIWNKYLDDIATLEINISFESKKSIETKIKNISNIDNELEKLKIFDNALRDIDLLLLQSYQRFRVKK